MSCVGGERDTTTTGQTRKQHRRLKSMRLFARYIKTASLATVSQTTRIEGSSQHGSSDTNQNDLDTLLIRTCSTNQWNEFDMIWTTIPRPCLSQFRASGSQDYKPLSWKSHRSNGTLATLDAGHTRDRSDDGQLRAQALR